MTLIKRQISPDDVNFWLKVSKITESIDTKRVCGQNITPILLWRNFYLDFHKTVIGFCRKGKVITSCDIVQLAYQRSPCQASHIYGHTVGFHIAVHSTAPFSLHPTATYHVTLHGLFWYGFFEGDDAVHVCCPKKNVTDKTDVTILDYSWSRETVKLWMHMERWRARDKQTFALISRDNIQRMYENNSSFSGPLQRLCLHPP